MTTPAELSSLIERCKAATEASRELDGEIAKLVRELPSEARFETENVYGQETNQWVSGGYGAYKFYEPEAYTSSIDAIVALIEKEFPGCCWFLEGGGDEDYGANIIQKDGTRSTTDWLKSTPALALCTAFLTALIEARQKP